MNYSDLRPYGAYSLKNTMVGFSELHHVTYVWNVTSLLNFTSEAKESSNLAIKLVLTNNFNCFTIWDWETF